MNNNNTSSANTKRIAILCNPFAGKGQALKMAEEAEQFAQKRAWQVVLNTQSTHAGHIENGLSAQLTNAIDLVILIGGDGTLRELITGLRKHKVTLEIAFIPMGNANVVARELGIPLNPRKALNMLDSSTTTAVDIGILTPEHEAPMIFLAMLEIGFGAKIVHMVNQLRLGKLQRLYQFWGDLVYALAGILALIKPHSLPIKVESEKALSVSTHIILANMKTYAKGWSLTPEANYQDGLLDLAYNKTGSQLATLTAFFNATKQKPSPDSRMGYLQLKEVRLSGSNKVFMQLDGDPVFFSGAARVSIEKAAFIIHQPNIAKAL